MISDTHDIKNNDTRFIKTNTDLSFKLIIFFIFIASSITLGYYFQIQLIIYISILLTTVIFIVSKLKEKIEIYAFLLPFTNIFKIDPSFSSIVSLYLIIIILSFFISTKKIKINKISLILLIAFIVFTMAITLNLDLNYFQFIMNMFFLLVVTTNMKLLISLKELIYALTIGIVLSSFSGILLYKLPHMQHFWKEFYIEGVQRFSGLYYDSNIYSLVLLFAISLLIVMIFSSKKIEAINFFLIVLLIIFGLTTISKTFILGLVFLLVYVILFLLYKINVKMIFLLIFFIFTIGIVFITSDTTSIYLEKITNRLFKVDSLDDFTNSRITIQLTYIDIILTNLKGLFLGHGFTTFSIRSNGINFSAHNTALQMIYYTGLIGFFIFNCFILSLFYFLKKTSTEGKSRFISWAPLLVLVFVSFSLDLIFVEYTSFFLLIAMLIIYKRNLLNIKE